MSVLDELKPIRKLLVMNLLREIGVDVSQWKNYKGAHASANPKYCYNWSFEQPGEVVVVCAIRLLAVIANQPLNRQVYFANQNALIILVKD